MTPQQIEALKLALEALGNTWTEPKSEQYKVEKEAITAIKEALAQPEREPDQKRPQNCGTGYCSCIECVMKPSPRAWLIEFENGDEELHFDEQSVGEIHVPLYTTPPRRTWVDLTPQDLNDIFKISHTGEGAVYLALKIIKEKNA